MLLRDTWLFSDCTDDELRRIGAACTRRAVPAGAVVLREGTRGVACFVVVEGQAVVERGGQILGNDGPPAVIGAIALAGCAHTSTVTAATGMRLLAFDRGTYARMLQEGLLKSVAHRVQVVVAEQRRIDRCTPVDATAPAGVL